MGGNSDLMYNVRHVRFQISGIVCTFLFSFSGAVHFLHPAFSSPADVLDPVQKHFVVKGLQHKIVRPKIKSILCDPFLSHSRNYDKRGNLFQIVVMT